MRTKMSSEREFYQLNYIQSSKNNERQLNSSFGAIKSRRLENEAIQARRHFKWTGKNQTTTVQNSWTEQSEVQLAELFWPFIQQLRS